MLDPFSRAVIKYSHLQCIDHHLTHSALSHLIETMQILQGASEKQGRVLARARLGGTVLAREMGVRGWCQRGGVPVGTDLTHTDTLLRVNFPARHGL